MCSQIWWLDSELTCGQTRPLVFTQGHSVCNRSFFPCFDTPAVKSTYTATVRVSPLLERKASALPWQHRCPAEGVPLRPCRFRTESRF